MNPAVFEVAGMPNLIDCHVLTLPRFPQEWQDTLRNDLDGEPVNQHWLLGIDGDLAASRVAGYSIGDAPFVTSQDPDDRVVPGVYAALLQALADAPDAPFAWAGEQYVMEDLQEIAMRPNVWPGGYSPRLHLTKGQHVHGVKLYRRELVTPLLERMRTAGLCCEFFLDHALAQPTRDAPRPVHVPIVGRLWRQHPQNGSKRFKVEDFDQMAQALGFGTMAEMRAKVRAN